MTNLPGLPALVAASAAFLISTSLRPASSARVSNVTGRRAALLQRVLLERGLQRRELGVQRAQLGLAGLGQLRAGAHEVLVIAPQQARGFGVETQRIALLVQRVDAREQARVEVHLVAVRGELGRHLALHGLQLRIGVGAGQVVEDGLDASQHPARALHRDDGVVEGRLVRVGRDRLDLLAVFGDALLERRQEVVVADLVEAREVQRQRAFDEQRVRRRRVGGLDGAHERGQRGSHQQVAQGLGRGVHGRPDARRAWRR